MMMQRSAIDYRGTGGAGRAHNIATWRQDYMKSLGPLGYDEASARLSPAGPTTDPEPVQAQPAPGVSDTATATLDGIVDSDHENDGMCYLENALKVKLVLEDHLAALQADGVEADPEEIARVERLIGVLAFAEKLVNGGSNRNADAQNAFPDASLTNAVKEARAMYSIMGTMSVRNQPTPMRAAGIGGAMAAMGGGELLYHQEMVDGGLRPGAPLQMWWPGAYRLVGQEEQTEMTAKQVYQNFTRGRIASGEYVGGHSVTFVRYDETSPSKIHYLQQWDNQLAEHELTDEGTYFVGANLSTTGDAELTAEYVLMDTEFKADYGLDLLTARAASHNLDAGRMSDLLLAQIAASGHPDLATIQAAADRLGRQSAFNHNLVRLIGLWQHAVGISCDGDFGNGSSTQLTGQPLSTATAIQHVE